MWCVVMWISGPALVQALSITVYTDRASWEAATTGTILEESFGNATLNAGITVQSDMGYVNTTNGV